MVFTLIEFGLYGKAVLKYLDLLIARVLYLLPYVPSRP